MKDTINKPEISIYYDGDCPFCSNFVLLMKLRENYTVDLVNLREDTEARDRLSMSGFDLNEGMVVESGGAAYFGAEAVRQISLMARKRGFAEKLLAAVLSGRRTSRWLYPLMRTGRNLTLRALGRSKL